MELILGAIAAIVLFWAVMKDLLKPPKPKKTPDQELADAMRKFMKSEEENKQKDKEQKDKK